MQRIFIAGFSQGSCLALEVAARFAVQYGIPEKNRLQVDQSFRDTAHVLRMTRYLVGWAWEYFSRTQALQISDRPDAMQIDWGESEKPL